MIACPNARPLWLACLKFCRDVLKERDGPSHVMAIIFGTVGPDELMTEAGLAFIRHTLGKYYRDVTLIHTKKLRIHWTRTFRRCPSQLQRHGLALRIRDATAVREPTV
jgi:hypothetical protein